MTLHGSATPGVYAIDKSSRDFTGDFASVVSFPFHCLCNSKAFSLTSIFFAPLHSFPAYHTIKKTTNQGNEMPPPGGNASKMEKFLPVPRRNAKKGPFPVHPIPGCRRKLLIRPSFPALPAEREIPATALPGMTRRPSDEPPARLRRKSTKAIRKEKKKTVPHAQEPCAGRVSRFSEPCCLSC